MNKQKRLSYSTIVLFVICVVISAIFVTFFSGCTSVLNPHEFGGDSAQFLTIGKGWYEGLVPYRDLFDHKGPFIFFVDMLGYYIGGGDKSGVSIIQIIFMSATVYGFTAIASLYKKTPIYYAIAIIISLIAVLVNYTSGNTVEEFCMPFLVWSSYYAIRFLKGDSKEHNANVALLYGVAFAVCMLTRVTNFIPLSGFMVIIGVVLVKDKKWRNVGENILMFLIGFSSLFVPFSVYFIAKECFYEYINAMLLFNIKYTNQLSSWVVGAGSYEIKYFIYRFFPYYIIFIIALIRLIKKDYKYAASLIITGVLETYLFMSIPSNPQYPLVCTGAGIIVMLINEITELYESRESECLLIGNIVLFFLLTFIFKSAADDVSSPKQMYSNRNTARTYIWGGY